MITIQELRIALKEAIEETGHATASCSKSVFLNALRDRLMDKLPSVQGSDEIVMLLKRSNELPVSKSRLDPLDLQRQEKCFSWKKLNGSIQGIRDLVWEATTVFAGDCDVCLGAEMVYLWDADFERMVRVCDLCSNTLDLRGGKVASSGCLEAPTQQQLRAVGVIDAD